ncbi:MAG TPA: Hpt domain-containing protein [Candidatus Latescibacteria bacterium]|nr:Hpt domain-containing protein [Candidatus Latescibacterota bacterium]
MEAGDDSSVSEYLHDFVAAAPETIAALRQSLEEGSFDEVSRLAHNLKGSSLFLGIDALAGMADRLELASERHDPNEVASVLSQIQAKIAEIVSILQSSTSPPPNDDLPGSP